MKKKNFRSLSSTIALLVMICAVSFCSLISCATDDLGLCTISTTGDDLVYEEISIEECQDIFGSTAGARGWSWDPQD